MLPGRKPERAEPQERRDSWRLGFLERVNYILARIRNIFPEPHRERQPQPGRAACITRPHHHRTPPHNLSHSSFATGRDAEPTTQVTDLGNRETRVGHGQRERTLGNGRDLEAISSVECNDDRIVDLARVSALWSTSMDWVRPRTALQLRPEGSVHTGYIQSTVQYGYCTSRERCAGGVD